MSLPKFWNNVRTRTNLSGWGSLIDFPKFDPALIEKLLRKSPGWFAPVAVAGFDEADFSFLPAEDRVRLTGLVKEFRAIVAEVPPTTTPDDRLERALPVFRDIVGLLEFDRYGDAEAFRIGKRIEATIAPHRPEAIAELRFHTGKDNTGDPSIRLWAVLHDEAAEKAVFARNTHTIRDLLTETSEELAPELWPYVDFRTVSEQAELLEDARR